MEQYFATLFEDVSYERSLIILLSLINQDILKQSYFTDDETNIVKNLTAEKLHRQKNIKRACCDGFVRKTIFYFTNDDLSKFKQGTRTLENQNKR